MGNNTCFFTGRFNTTVVENTGTPYTTRYGRPTSAVYSGLINTSSISVSRITVVIRIVVTAIPSGVAPTVSRITPTIVWTVPTIIWIAPSVIWVAPTDIRWIICIKRRVSPAVSRITPSVSESRIPACIRSKTK